MKYLFLSALIASLVGVMTPIGSSAYSSASGFPPNVFGAIWDESTILKCKNHPICNNS
jgi:hypothetical protein